MLWLVQDHGLEESFTALPISAMVVVKSPLSLFLLLFRNKGCKGCRDGYTCLSMKPDQIIKYKSFPIQEALRALWQASFPDTNLSGLISEQWKDMGWQGPNPSTDFRGCGFVSLENLLFFARTYPASYNRILFKQEGMRAAWEYPFAVAGINVSFMLIQMLDLYSAKPKSLPGVNFIKILSEDEAAFDVLYCIAFQMMDAQWLAMRASYLQFKDVIQATRIQLERELSLDDIHRIRDLPAYNLLYK